MVLFAAYAGNLSAAADGAVQQCLLQRIETAGDETTIGQLRADCSAKALAASLTQDAASESTRPTVVDIRRAADFDNRSRPFSISTYKQNYFIYTYSDGTNEEPYQVDASDFLEKDETKFQVSFKMPIATGLFGGDTDLLFAYTSVAWWQTLNDDIANPFRETNYEPEIFFRHYTNKEILGLQVIDSQLGLNHQSNGRSEPTSRGWDRVIGSVSAQLTDDLVVGLRAWGILDTQQTNSDIEDYVGYGDIGLGWAPNRNTFTLMYRPASDGDAVQLTWSYPITDHLRLYAQYWNGYGESLVDYNSRTERIGLGIALSDIIARY